MARPESIRQGVRITGGEPDHPPDNGAEMLINDASEGIVLRKSNESRLEV